MCRYGTVQERTLSRYAAKVYLLPIKTRICYVQYLVPSIGSPGGKMIGVGPVLPVDGVVTARVMRTLDPNLKKKGILGILILMLIHCCFPNENEKK